jgi:hypothetical protein
MSIEIYSILKNVFIQGVLTQLLALLVYFDLEKKYFVY